MKVWPRERKFVKFRFELEGNSSYPSSSYQGSTVIHYPRSKHFTVYLKKKSFFNQFVLLLFNNQQRPRKLSFTGLHIGHYIQSVTIVLFFFLKNNVVLYSAYKWRKRLWVFQAWPVRNGCSVLKGSELLLEYFKVMIFFLWFLWHMHNSFWENIQIMIYSSARGTDTRYADASSLISKADLLKPNWSL